MKNYHVYAGYADGSERFVGGAYAANYYIQTLEDAQNVTCLKVRAVGDDGSESEPAVLNLEQTNRVSNGPHHQRGRQAECHLDRS